MRKNLAEVLNQGPTSLSLVNQIINACSEAKGQDVQVLDVSSMSDIADYFVLVSGRSDRHVQGITNRILEALEEAGIEPDSIEGTGQYHWVLGDFGDVVVHVFYEPVRSHYDLEGLWFKAPRLKIRATRKQGKAQLCARA